MLTRRYTPNTQHSNSGAASAQTNERIEALKKKNFRPGESVVAGGSIIGEFIRGDLKTGDAYVRFSGRGEQKVNPKNLERSNKAK